MGVESPGTSRISSLDQFRGYTVVGMFFVNFVGHFREIPAVFKHHNTYCSYADTIMPQFFFAVGFAYRLTLLRRLQTQGPWVAYSRAFRRNLGLILLGMVIYHLNGRAANWSQLQEMGVVGFFRQAFLRDPFETLVHIGVTAIWVMPVIAAGTTARIAFAAFSAALHLLLSYIFYFRFAMTFPVIDGGPLGFLSWSIPLLVGSLAYDAVMPKDHESTSPRTIFGAAMQIFAWGMVLMIVGYGLSCLSTLYDAPGLTDEEAGVPELAEKPVWPLPDNGSGREWTTLLAEPPLEQPTTERYSNYWMMSQRAGTISYLIFGSGLSLALYALFVLACDIGPFRLGIFRTFGNNALAAYIIHQLVEGAMRPYTPRDSPLWFALASFGLFLGICYVFVRHLEKNNLFLRM
jgi:predicted acyltransferase